MPEIDAFDELGRKLLRMGAPRHYVRRIIEELGEHREDLEAEAMAEGQPPDVARSIAREKLGDIDELAKELLTTKRHSYWWGRHPVVSFILLPLPVFILLFLGMLWLWGEVSGLIAWTEHRESLPMPDWAAVRVGFYGTLCAALTICAGFICYLTRRCCCGLKWTLIGCAFFLAQALFLHTGFTPPHGVPAHGNFWIGYGLRAPDLPQLIAWIVPLVLFVLYCVVVRRPKPLIRTTV